MWIILHRHYVHRKRNSYLIPDRTMVMVHVSFVDDHWREFHNPFVDDWVNPQHDFEWINRWTRRRSSSIRSRNARERNAHHVFVFIDEQCATYRRTKERIENNMTMWGHLYTVCWRNHWNVYIPYSLIVDSFFFSSFSPWLIDHYDEREREKQVNPFDRRHHSFIVETWLRMGIHRID